MIICISGMSGSGKTTIARMLADELKIRHVNRSFKEFATGKQLVAFQKRVKPSFDRSFDKEIIREAKSADSVVSTWFGPWMVKDSSLNVWLRAGLETRVRRIASANHLALREARSYIKRKDGNNILRARKVYGIDIVNDHSVFDIEINTERMKPKEEVALIAMLSVERGGKRFK